eukprot:483631-Rhodomonas_salina.1
MSFPLALPLSRCPLSPRHCPHAEPQRQREKRKERERAKEIARHCTITRHFNLEMDQDHASQSGDASGSHT